ncbi:YARHG domain-containing protein, partial [Salmonella enterica]|uniref:YARHG domain-containing protein n=1 Tax=Salmonella enterica TaxID=28901 RepID=UPI003CF011CB
YINNRGIDISNVGSNLSGYDYDYYYNTYRGDNSYIIPDSSIRKLTANELYGCSPQLLALIRNEIYARNGYVFSKQEYRDYFSS